MRRPDVGAFGVAAIVVTLLLQTAGLATVLASAPRPDGLVAVVLAVTTGRVAVLLAARPGVPAAEGSALGVLVAGTAPAALGWGVAAALLAAAGGTQLLLGGGARRRSGRWRPCWPAFSRRRR